MKTIQQIKTLCLDANILEIWENILLCRKDLLEENEQASLAQSLLQISLDNLILSTTFDKKKIFQFFLASFTLFTPPASVLHTLLFKPIIGLIPIETVITTI